ncbi:MAG: DMT family transporter [Gammaproteobacteria bacterium]|nr:DMT family transporter [Gammaproteobacteria bacterium]
MFGLSRYYSGMIFALVTACGLGAITSFAKLFYADGGNALALMLVRFVASTLIFGLLVLVRRDGFSVHAARRLPLFAIGLIWSGGMVCYLVAIETISVSLGVLIFYTYPLLVLAYSAASRQLKPSPGLIALFVGAFAGLYLALAGGEFRVDASGILFAALASCAAAFTFVRGARVAPSMSPLVMTFWINATGLLFIAPFILASAEFPGAPGGGGALIVATLLYLVAILSQFEALARLPAARAAFLLNLEPVVSIALARLLLAETLSPMQTAGVIIVISAVILSLRFRPANA